MRRFEVQELVDNLKKIRKDIDDVDQKDRVIFANFSRADLLERLEAVLLDPAFPSREEESHAIKKILSMSSTGKIVLREK